MSLEEVFPFPCCGHCGCGTPSGVWTKRNGHDDTCAEGCNDEIWAERTLGKETADFCVLNSSCGHRLLWPAHWTLLSGPQSNARCPIHKGGYALSLLGVGGFE